MTMGLEIWGKVFKKESKTLSSEEENYSTVLGISINKAFLERQKTGV